MTSEEQFEALWKIGCKTAILAIIKNQGRALSMEQLNVEIDSAINQGLVGHAVTLATLAESNLSSVQLDRLVNRCLELGWVTDALHAGQQGILAGKTRQELIDRLLTSGYATTLEDAEKLLVSE